MSTSNCLSRSTILVNIQDFISSKVYFFTLYCMFWFIQFYPLYANYNYKERCELWKSFAIRLICFTIMKILLKAKSSMINSLKIVTCTENCWSALALLLLFKILILIPTYAFFLSVPLSTRVTFCAIRPHKV